MSPSTVTPDAATVPPSSPLDAGLDASAPLEAGPVVINCQTADSGIACDDGKHCSGVELCSPSDLRADMRGCVAGEPPACALGQTCSEQLATCSACSDSTLDDADGDGHEAASCGGDDCRDDDPAIYKSNVERCDGKDNDCDGNVDGPVAEQACLAAAPAGATSTCMASTCVVTCLDPDFDLVAGACVRHDDCAGVTACGAGSCVDGVRTYICTCPAGYAGSGSKACSDVDECASASTNSCDTTPLACLNDPGTYHCTCPTTHLGDGQGASGCVRKVQRISAGNKHSCAILVGGGVKCWGSDQFGKLGLGSATETPHGNTPGSMGDALAYVSLGAGRTAVSIAAGSDVTCAALDDGRAKCWGYNGYGALGGGMPGGNGISNAYAPLPDGRKTSAVGAGSGMGFSLLDDGSLGHWGLGYIGYSFVAGERFKSFDRSPLYDSYHLCAVLESGAVRCFPGAASYADPGEHGPLGWAFNTSLPASSYPLTALGTGRTATAVALGERHSCALLDDASVKCWGRNDYGQLGLGDTLSRGRGASEMGDALQVVPVGAPVRAIAAGANHTCVLLDGGQVKCWGLNDSGQLGQGTRENLGDQPGELSALVAIDLGVGEKAVAIDVGSHSCAVLESGALKCWGTNSAGELGQGDTLNRGETPGSLGSALKAIDVGG